MERPESMAISEDQLRAACKAARDAAQNAYAPYSKFRVGTAVVGDSGRIFAGSNVENVSYPATVCAERIALGAAVTAGEKGFQLLVLTALSENIAIRAENVTPCGVCLQWLSELAPNCPIYVCDRDVWYTLRDLLRVPFTADSD